MEWGRVRWDRTVVSDGQDACVCVCVCRKLKVKTGAVGTPLAREEGVFGRFQGLEELGFFFLFRSPSLSVVLCCLSHLPLGVGFVLIDAGLGCVTPAMMGKRSSGQVGESRECRYCHNSANTTKERRVAVDLVSQKKNKLSPRTHHLEQSSHCTQMKPSWSVTSNLAPEPSPRPRLTPPPPPLGVAAPLAPAPPPPVVFPPPASTPATASSSPSPTALALTVTTRVGCRQLASHACGGGRTAITLTWTPRRIVGPMLFAVGGVG